MWRPTCCGPQAEMGDRTSLGASSNFAGGPADQFEPASASSARPFAACRDSCKRRPARSPRRRARRRQIEIDKEGLKDADRLFAAPIFPSAVMALAESRHEVIESARSSSSVARPLSSVINSGRHNSVSGNHWRTRAGQSHRLVSRLPRVRYRRSVVKRESNPLRCSTAEVTICGLSGRLDGRH